MSDNVYVCIITCDPLIINGQFHTFRINMYLKSHGNTKG